MSTLILIAAIHIYAIIGLVVGANGVWYLPPWTRETPGLKVLFSYLIAITWPVFIIYALLKEEL